MATIQDALAAMQAQKSPFESLLEGVSTGVAGAQDKALENTKTLIALEQQRKQAQQQAALQQQLKNAVEGKTQNDLKAVGGSNPVLPVQKFQEEFTQDEKGNISVHYKPKDDAAGTYTAEQTRALIPGDKTEGLIKSFPGGQIPKDAVHQLIAASKSDVSLGEKDKQFTAKRLTAFGDALDPSKQRSGAFGVSKQVFDRAERLQSLASAYSSNNLDSRQMEELAIGLNAMLSGSNTGAQSQVTALVPKTAMGNIQKFKEWLVNDPQGTDQQAFVQRMLGSIDREKQTAADQIKRTQFQRTARYADLEKSSPDEFYNTLQSNGLDPEEYKQWKKNGFKPMTAVQAPDNSGGGGGSFEPDVMAYAQKHGITPIQAQQVKMARTGGR